MTLPLTRQDGYADGVSGKPKQPEYRVVDGAPEYQYGYPDYVDGYEHGSSVREQSSDSSIEQSPRGITELGSRNWVRWATMLPAALAAYIGAQAVVAIANSFTPLPEFAETAYSQVVNSVVGPLAFVYVGAKVAPRRQFLVALALTVLHAVAIATVITAVLMAGTYSQPAWFLLSTSALGIVATVILCRHMRGGSDAAT